MEKIVEVGGKKYRAVVKEYNPGWSFQPRRQNVRGVPKEHREEALEIAKKMVNHGELRFFPVKGKKA